MPTTLTFGELLHPAVVHSRADVLARPSAVPSVAGLYAWYFDEPVPGVPRHGCHVSDHGTLLYVGISPGPPPRNGKAPSTQNLYKRVRYHYTGNAEGSTLRLTLGCHLAQTLGIELRRVGSGIRLTFTPSGEAALSEWMARHARVAVLEHPCAVGGGTGPHLRSQCAVEYRPQLSQSVLPDQPSAQSATQSGRPITTDMDAGIALAPG